MPLRISVESVRAYWLDRSRIPAVLAGRANLQDQQFPQRHLLPEVQGRSLLHRCRVEGLRRERTSGQTVFVSSVMADIAAERKAVCDAVEDLGGRVLLFERLGGRDDDAQAAYITGVRSSDIYVGILGNRYGKPEPTGYSPTHTEYNEAIDSGLRICVWATTGVVDGRQRDFLEEIRTFHSTGSYSNPDDLREGLTRRLADLASAASSPWCKVGSALFRVRRCADDRTRVRVEASVRDDNIVAELEGLRPGDWGGNQMSRITCAGRRHAVRIDDVVVEATVGRSRLVRIEATKIREPSNAPGLLDVGYGEWSPEDQTEANSIGGCD